MSHPPEVPEGPPPEPVDPDVDLHVAGQRRELRDAPWAVLGAISLGGAIGAGARHALALAVPDPPGGFAWSTFTVNVTGCLLIGALMVLVTDVWPDRRLLRPFVGVGILGGYTTFATHIVDAQSMLAAGNAATALGYLGATLACGLTAVAAGAALTARLAGLLRGRRTT
ncbi:FluC/FEX family fluoride channel [Marinitenerispora sediminis]|uniref:Fluoride-specific ion channel FluC n=1 Tax=Marinitenerispora sediminis TaxID=1931232 RepID=A0A368TB62_9ACTN|nr:CrcB family protein [Marinitenerispora sediminis]RCV50778.1 fluoride efflux transporter CrcB [Marinitenerispora sediminis]RCV52668.1 fluoride efflux transporter CrcB [Marinitenerispora sediminis]RCV62084.1 fluoride efflux transporter CrcB [Marinitenerispora sediminis]